MHLKADHLIKELEGKPVVSDLSFEARAGYILGILGPDGAGKTTILRILVDILRPDSGAVFYEDQPMNRKIRSVIGYLPEARGLYGEYSVNQNLVYFARLKNLSRKKAQVESVRLMDRFNIIEQMDMSVALLSEEDRQKVQIMCAIIHNPDLLILDEPFAAMHPNNQTLIRKLIQHFKDEGKTIILATRALNEAETICDEVLLIDQGRAVLQDNLKKIKEKFRESLIYVEAAEELQSLQDIFGVKRMIQDQHAARLYIDNQVSTQKILDIIIRSVNVKKIEVHRPNLNDIFLEVLHNGHQKGKS